MTTLTSLKSLLNSLKSEEIKSLLNYLRYYQDFKEDSGLKAASLVEIIISEPGCSARELQVALYGNENYSAFNKLLNRTKDKIYEVMLFDSNLSKPTYSERNKTIFDLKKKVIQSEILSSRGLNKELVTLQERIINRAKQFEMYETLLEVLYAKQRNLGFRLGTNAHRKLEDEINFYEYARISNVKSRQLFNKLNSKIITSSSTMDYYIELQDAVRQLQFDFEKTKSAIIGYYYYFLKTELLQINNQLEDSRFCLLQLIELVKNNKSVYTDNRIGTAYLNLANNELLDLKFSDAISYINYCKQFFKNVRENFEMAREAEFFARLYCGELIEAEKIIEEIHHSSRSSNTPFLYNKRAYLYACVKTLKGELGKSNELLDEVKEITKDKEGWNIGKRILTIINRIEVGEFDSADLQVMNLEKFIKRILKFRNVRKRDITILRILRYLISEGFDFKKVYESRKLYFDLLESNDEDYCWKIKSPELVVFHKWFLAKMNSNPYQFSIS